MINIIENIKTKLIKKLLGYIKEDVFMIENTLIVKNFNYENDLNDNENLIIINKNAELSINSQGVMLSDKYLLIQDIDNQNGLIDNDKLVVCFKDDVLENNEETLRTKRHLLIKNYKEIGINAKNKIYENDDFVILRKNDKTASDIIENEDILFIFKNQEQYKHARLNFYTLKKDKIIDFKNGSLYSKLFFVDEEMLKYKGYRKSFPLQKILNLIASKIDVEKKNRYIEFIYKLFINDINQDIIHVDNIKIYNNDIQNIAFLFYEIFCLEPYHFNSISEKPYIIDCGSNIGMSILYFKNLYPECNIIAFEASTETFKLLQDNIKLNSFSNVELLNYAVSNYDGEQEFYFCENDMSSSLVRKDNLKEEFKKEKVITKKLSSYIDIEIDFLKIDIEGEELKVLLEIQDKLYLVKNMFIEYHHKIINNNLDEIIKILENNGFEYFINDAVDSSFQKLHKPFGQVGKLFSLNIYAKRVDIDE